MIKNELEWLDFFGKWIGVRSDGDPKMFFGKCVSVDMIEGVTYLTLEYPSERIHQDESQRVKRRIAKKKKKIVNFFLKDDQ